MATAGRSTWTTSAELHERLGAWLRTHLGADARVSELRRLAGGASREMWAFTLQRAEAAPERLVLRRDPPGHVVNTSRGTEQRLLRAAAAAGVPVPAVRFGDDDPAPLGSPFFVMELVPGETIARKLLRDAEFAAARAALPEQLARALAAIHRMDPAVAPELPRPVDQSSAALAEVERQEELFRGIAPDPHPAIELALRWLRARAPQPRRLALVHGDFRLGNVIVGPEGLRAVLDWELAHVGDPLEDLGWLCVRAWRFGNDTLPVAGLCDRERLWRAYEAAGGDAVDPAAARWWEVYGTLKWAVICILQAHTFLAGVRSVELASLGRRICEMELELLDLMEG